MAALLLQTPALYLLSIPGIGVVYAADFTAQVGPITRFTRPAQIMSLAGNVPRVYDSAQYELRRGRKAVSDCDATEGR